MDIKDANWIIKTAWTTKTQLKMIYGNKSEEIDTLDFEDFLTLDRTSTINDRLNIDFVLDSEFIDRRNNAFLVIEKWYWKVREKNMLFNIDSRAMVEEDSVEAENLPEGDWINIRMNAKELWVRSSVKNLLLQDRRYQFELKMFPFVPFFHYKIQSEHFGIVENLKDPQREKNKRRSSIQHSLASTVNRAVIVEEGSIDKQFWKGEMGKTGAILEYQQGRQIPQFTIPAQLPESMMIMEQKSTSDIRDISGFNLNILGQKEAANESGILFEARVRQGNIQQQPSFDNFRLSKNLLGDLKLQFIQNIYTRQEFIRIIGDNPSQPEFVEVNKITEFGKVNDIVTGKYDTITTESFDSPTAKRYGFMILLEMAKLMPAELIPWHLIIDSADFTKKEEWKNYIQQRLGLPPEGLMTGQQPVAGTAPFANIPPELQALLAPPQGQAQVAPIPAA